MLEAARAGATYEEVEAAGRDAVTEEQTRPGVAALVVEVRLEVLLDDGVRLIVLGEPLGPSGDAAPGAIRQAPRVEREDHRDRIQLEVHNGSTRVVRVSSHYPFERVNPRLEFDRGRATGFRLDLPAGSSERWGPGETRTVDLVRPK
jgi:urease subunit gamma/beta